MSDLPANPLLLDPPEVIDRILRAIRFHVHSSLKKRGAVVAVSGGIDSAVCASLCVAALGPECVFALSLPERHSSPESADLASELAGQLGIQLIREDMGPLLDAAGCYRRQAEAIRQVFPEYQDDWSFNIVLPSLLSGERLNLPRLTIRNEQGERLTRRIPNGPYLQIIAATNFKQRSRTMTAYYHADRLNYAFCGTPNRLEYELGFFVKGGDGLSDFQPIAHLYKSQVYQIGEALAVPRSILSRRPTTDTFPLEQTQEEFYFAVPLEVLDACVHGLSQNVPVSAVAARIGLTTEQVERVYRDIEGKRRTTLPLHLPPLKTGAVQPLDDRVAELSRPFN
jgi:NAD+ synthase